MLNLGIAVTTLSSPLRPQRNTAKASNLQSLFIGLCGSFEGKELFLDILSGEVASPDDVIYKFKFLDPTNAVFPWVKFKETRVHHTTETGSDRWPDGDCWARSL